MFTLPNNLMPLSSIPTTTEQELEEHYCRKPNMAEKMAEDHDELIQQILEEEEHLIQAHQECIDQQVEIIKKSDVGLVNYVSEKESDVA